MTTLFDNTAFDTLTEQSAYWMGFFLADGTISKANQLRMKLAIKDMTHIYKLAKFLKAKNKISHAIGNRENSIFNHIGVYRRNGSRDIPTFLQNNRHFWRGVIDGDGHLSITKRGYPNLVLVGREEVLNAFLVFANQHFHFLRSSHWLKRDGAHVTKNPDEKIHRLQFIAQRAECLMHILYENAEIYLDRKKLIADSVIHYSDSPF